MEVFAELSISCCSYICLGYQNRIEIAVRKSKLKFGEPEKKRCQEPTQSIWMSYVCSVLRFGPPCEVIYRLPFCQLRKAFCYKGLSLIWPIAHGPVKLVSCPMLALKAQLYPCVATGFVLGQAWTVVIVLSCLWVVCCSMISVHFTWRFIEYPSLVCRYCWALLLRALTTGVMNVMLLASTAGGLRDKSTRMIAKQLGKCTSPS